MRTKHGSKETLAFTRHGLYRKPKPMNKLDGRRREVRAWKTFIGGITDDLGEELSFGQRALAEIAFWQYFALSEYMRWILLSGKDKAILTIMTERSNRIFNVTSNSFARNLAQVYGPNGLKKAKLRAQSLEEFLKGLPEKGEAPEEAQDQEENREENGEEEA